MRVLFSKLDGDAVELTQGKALLSSHFCAAVTYVCEFVQFHAPVPKNDIPHSCWIISKPSYGGIELRKIMSQERLIVLEEGQYLKAQLNRQTHHTIECIHVS